MKRMLGFFYVMILTLLFFITIYLQGWTLTPTMKLTMQFKDVQGLRKGDDVKVEGIIYGKVRELSLDPNGGVLVTAELQKEIEIYDDYEINVGSLSILGGNEITMKRGTLGHRKLDKKELTEPLAGKTKPSPFDELGILVKENREQISAAIRNIGDAAGELKKLGQNINEGQGTISLLLKDRALYDKVNQAVDNISGAVADVRDKLNKTDNSLGLLVNTTQLHDSVKATLDEVREVARKVNEGEGPLNALLNDKELRDDLKSTATNLKKISADVEKATDKMVKKESTIGHLFMDDKLYQDAEKTLEGVDKILGRAGRARVYVTGEYKSFPDSEMTISKIGLRIHPDETKYFYVGGSFLSLDVDGPIRFEKQIEEGESDTIITFDALAFYRIPWFLSDHLGVKAGYLEGKPGGGIEIDFEPLERWPVHVDFEIRDAYNDLSDEDIDEEIHGPMARVWAKVPLWTRPPDPPAKKGDPEPPAPAWWEQILHSIKLVGGVSRLQDDPEWFVGIGLEYRDEDIKTLVGLLSAGR